MFKFDSKFFEKRQKLLLSIANSQYLRWLLGIHRLPKELKKLKIDKITPNSIHHFIGKSFGKNGKYKQKITAEFYTRNRFAEALAYNLSPFCYFQSLRSPKFVWRFSPAGLAYVLLFGLLGKFAGLPLAFIGTTASYSVTGTDGRVGNENSSWSTCRSAVTGNSIRTSATASNYEAQIGYHTGTTYFYIKRTYITFNTTSIPTNSSITAGTLKVSITSKDDGFNDDYSYIAVVQATNNGSCTTSDYAKSGTTKGSSDYDVTDIAISTYLSIVLNTTGLGFISAGSNTDLAIKEGHDIENSSPAKSWNWSGIDIEASSEDDEPYLSVTYEIKPTGNFFQLF